MPSTNQKKPQARRWHTFRNSDALEHAVVSEIQHAAQLAIDERGAFLIVLAGGTTPRRVYEALRHIATEWSSWYVYYGDERCLPSDHIERNSQMAARAWLDHVKIPLAQVHTMSAEFGAPIASEDYARIVDKISLFDLVLLGLGEDGHTASLFPGQDWGDSPNAPSTIAVFDSPKPPKQRVSLSAHRLSEARNVMFLITGSNKTKAVTDWREGVSIPATAITPDSGVDIYIENSLIENSVDACKQIG